MKVVYKLFCCNVLIFSILTTKAQCWQSVGSGSFNSLALKQDGTLWSWGDGNYGQLGNGTNTYLWSPGQIGTGGNWKSITANSNHCLAIKQEGTLWAWGYNGWGQLGDGTVADRNEPVQIGSGNNWQSISAASLCTHAIKLDGTLWGWGNNNNGKVGDGSGSIIIAAPVQLGVAADWQIVDDGDEHILALKQNGTLWAWGVGAFGALGNGSNSSQHVPTQVGSASDWKSISAGQSHSLAIKQNGTLWAWGDNLFGQLGDGTNSNKSTPVQIGTDNSWQSISASRYYNLAIKQNGTLWAWGRNDHGQLGDGTLIDKNIPVQIGTANNWEITSSYMTYHSMALKLDGSLWTWGDNSYGQLGDESNIDNSTPSQIGSACSILPIDLLSFSGESYNKYNKLEWSTASELNNKYFAIERSLDALHFEEIGIKPAAGNTTLVNAYEFTDVAALEDSYYYRLKQVDFDSKFKISKVIKIKRQGENIISIYPNPLSNELFIKSKVKSGYYVILNSFGEKMQSGKYSTTGSVKTAHLPSGIYLIKIEGTYFKFIKN